jgi:hypothetical protein
MSASLNSMLLSRTAIADHAVARLQTSAGAKPF